MATDPSIGESTDPWVAGSEPRRDDRIGHYKILEEIGEGGFAKVYLAEQTQPVRRRVALKILKPGMDSRQIIARFEAERQALALMDHPNVARVLDAGTTETGRPYFVMDHVPGESITAYCDRHRLTTHRRLELLMQTCAAVQHAHQKGIIHRDIKPSNVLVTLNDGQPMVKVIDFGVAKAIDRRLTEQTVFTEHGQLIGTPEYMSPEQAEMTGLNVDTRTDIYSLGVLMYELLVGALPFEPKELRQAVVDEIRRRIREEDPPRPSRRLSSRSDAEFSTVAMHHGTSRAAMARELRGDLDWITMQAMDKDRTRRYATASELAADIRRHLQHEPVLARPPSPAYRVKKFVRRNRSVVGGAVAVFIVLIVGIVATGLALEAAVGQRREAQRQALIAQAVNEFLNYDLLAAVAPAKQGRQVTVREVLDVASTNIEGKFGDEPLVAASIRLTLAQTYFRLGEYQAAVPHGEIALRLRRAELGGDDPATLDAMNSLAVLYKYQSRYDEAETLYRMALRTLRRVMGDEDPLTLSSMNNLAVLLRSRGELHEAEALHREALATRRRVLGDEDPLTLSSITNLALLLKDRYELEEAEHLAREAMEMCLRILDEGHPQTLQSMNNLGTVLVARGELNEAESLYRRTLKTGRRVFGDKHSRVATMLRNLAGLLRRWGDDEGAEPLLLEALEIRRQALGEDDDATLAVMIDLGSCRAGLEKFDEAEAMLRESHTRLINLRGQAHQQTREVIVALADLYDAWGKADEAAAWRARLTPE